MWINLSTLEYECLVPHLVGYMTANRLTDGQIDWQHSSFNMQHNTSLTSNNICSAHILNLVFSKSYFRLTWGILKSFSRFATWIEVTLDGAPMTPGMTLRCISGSDPSLHLYSDPPMFAMDPKTKKRIH